MTFWTEDTALCIPNRGRRTSTKTYHVIALLSLRQIVSHGKRFADNVRTSLPAHNPLTSDQLSTPRDLGVAKSFSGLERIQAQLIPYRTSSFTVPSCTMLYRAISSPKIVVDRLRHHMCERQHIMTCRYKLLVRFNHPVRARFRRSYRV